VTTVSARVRIDTADPTELAVPAHSTLSTEEVGAKGVGDSFEITRTAMEADRDQGTRQRCSPPGPRDRRDGPPVDSE
jgi:hypothetical protein